MRQLCRGSNKGLRPAQYDKVDLENYDDDYGDNDDAFDDPDDDDDDLQDTKCELLILGDPYLKLGPFLLEHKNKAGNYIAQVRSIDI